MLVENATSFGTRAMNCMHLCLWKTLSQDCPHGEIRQFPISYLEAENPFGLVTPYFNVFFLCLSLRYALLELGTDPKKWHKNFKVLAIMMKPKPIKNKLMKTWKAWNLELHRI